MTIGKSMKIFVFILLWLSSYQAIANNLTSCDLSSNETKTHECEITLDLQDEQYFFVFPKFTKIKTLKINNHSVVHQEKSYFEDLGGYILVAKSAYPIPPGFLEKSKQTIWIEWSKPPQGEFQLSLQTNVRSPATDFINYIPSSFVLAFIIILMFIRQEFIDEQKFFSVSILTGLVMAMHLYNNSLELYIFLPKYVNLVSKIHVLTTSLVTVLLIYLSDRFLSLFKRKWYWSAFIITFILILITPGISGDDNTYNIINCLIPSMIITTATVVVVTFKIVKYKLYQTDSSYYPIIISGIFVTFISLMDTLVAIYDRFGEPPISGYSLLLFYIIVNLTYIIRSKKMKINQLAIHSEVASVSRQVAHDIKSPLAALKIAIDSFNEIPSEKKHFIKRSVERIDDIINDLQQKSQQEEKHDTLLLMSSVLNAVISEKRLTLNNKDISIINNTLDRDQLTFVRANRSTLKRMLSNLINNAIEALPNQHGLIELNLNIKDQKWCNISIKDNGQGIPAHLIEQIKQKHFSYGKIGGQGLGLSYVYEQVNKWSGSLQITSQVNHGTTIDFTVPLASSPNWFCSNLHLSSYKTLFVVDDDSSIFELWKAKLKDLTLELIHIQTPDDFLKRMIEIDQTNHFVIIDLDYMGSTLNGFDLIKKLKQARCILSTSRFEESEIQNKCSQENIQLLSKDFIQHVTINQHKTIVLIDNDELICEGWKIIGAKKNIDVQTYSNLEALPPLAKQTLIFIDYELEQSKNGIEVAKILYDMGYREIYLCTGHGDIMLSDYPFLRGIVGKDFPAII
jgi:signal transduction histidine kinase/FixJ family two-component response regulator